MADPSFGPGYPDCDPADIVTLTRPDGLRVPLHRDVAELVGILIDRTEALGVDVRPGETWGYSCRAVRGSDQPSNHSWGTAVDLNAPANPMATANWHRKNATAEVFGLRLHTELTEEIVTEWESAGFRWGGRYSKRPDPMHFEYMGTADEALAQAAALRGAPEPTAATSAPEPEPQPQPAPEKPSAASQAPKKGSDVDVPTLQRGSQGSAVEALQAILNHRLNLAIKIDGHFGPTTERTLARYQTAAGLEPDGVAGPVTWAAVL